jgi:MFS family permease
VALAPIAPMAVFFLLARSALSQMDVPARQTLVVSVVRPEERSAAAATTGLARTIAATAGPSAGGALLGTFAAAPFIAAATLKAAYDLTLLTLFRSVPMESEAAASTQSDASPPARTDIAESAGGEQR